MHSLFRPHTSKPFSPPTSDTINNAFSSNCIAISPTADANGGLQSQLGDNLSQNNYFISITGAASSRIPPHSGVSSPITSSLLPPEQEPTAAPRSKLGRLMTSPSVRLVVLSSAQRKMACWRSAESVYQRTQLSDLNKSKTLLMRKFGWSTRRTLLVTRPFARALP